VAIVAALLAIGRRTAVVGYETEMDAAVAAKRYWPLRGHKPPFDMEA
jgi:hypothetical protein